MSLQDIFEARYGKLEAEKVAEENQEVELTKEAADAMLEKALGALSEEEAEKIATVVEAMDEEGVEFDHDLHKLAAAAEVVDEYAQYQDDVEKQAAELDTAGRLMARALVDELGKIAAESEAQPEVKVEEQAPEAAPATLSEKLAKAVEVEEAK